MRVRVDMDVDVDVGVCVRLPNSRKSPLEVAAVRCSTGGWCSNLDVHLRLRLWSRSQRSAAAMATAGGICTTRELIGIGNGSGGRVVPADQHFAPMMSQPAFDSTSPVLRVLFSRDNS